MKVVASGIAVIKKIQVVSSHFCDLPFELLSKNLHFDTMFVYCSVIDLWDLCVSVNSKSLS